MPGECLLLLEDDPAIAETVCFALEREGFTVLHALLVGQARQAWQGGQVALAVLDVGLPDGSGLDLLREIRAAPQAATLPVLMLTARAEEIDRVLGLELGADDYLTKPFSTRELVARVRAMLRRAGPPAAAAPAGWRGDFEHDDAGQRVRYAGRWLELTRLEYGLLSTLLRASGRILSRQHLLDAVWGPGSDAGDRTVDTHVKTLRAKLRDVRPQGDPIATHRGMGYSLDAGRPAG